MTTPCFGGTSSPKSGFGETVSMGSAGMAEMITKFVPDGWAIALVVGLAGITYDLITLCQNDPPALPTITAAEAEAFISLSDLSLAASAAGKLKDLVTHYAWFQFCNCNDGTIPIPTVAPNPVGWTPPSQVTQVTTQEQSPAPCFVYNRDVTFAEIGAGVSDLFGLPGGIDPSSSGSADLIPNPKPSFARLTVTTDAGSDGPGVGYAASILTSVHGSFPFHNFANTGIVADGTSQQGTGGTFTAGDTSWVLDISTGGTPAATGHIKVELWCNGQFPTGVNSACCPPDPTLAVQVERLLRMVTLIQRQVAPFAYVPGASHVGLSGSGEISVQGLLGIKVNPTTIPSHFGLQVGDPDTLWLDSWIRWGNADGWSERRFLSSAPYVSIPPLAGQYTKIGYTLQPGVVVDFLELVREP